MTINKINNNIINRIIINTENYIQIHNENNNNNQCDRRVGFGADFQTQPEKLKNSFIYKSRDYLMRAR